MAETSDDYASSGAAGGVGKYGTGFCTPTPSDLAGAVDNLLTRIQDLEREVEQLKATNAQAGELSELATQVGWVGGITYAGIDGWTLTEAGTLIPPAGFSLSSAGWLMSDGNVYTGVVMDENGVHQFDLSV